LSAGLNLFTLLCIERYLAASAVARNQDYNLCVVIYCINANSSAFVTLL
jgi:hypothetical protein